MKVLGINLMEESTSMITTTKQSSKSLVDRSVDWLDPVVGAVDRHELSWMTDVVRKFA